MFRTALVLALSLAFAFPTPQEPSAAPGAQSPAPQITNGERRETTLVVAAPEGGLRAAVSIGYGQPVWRADYEEALDGRGANYTSLGTGWWTTLDTIGPIELGGVRVEPGSYFLGLKPDAGPAFSLLLFDGAQTMQARLLPQTTALYRGDAKPRFQVPMTFARGQLAKSADRLEIELVGSPTDRGAVRLSIRWGKHELTAPVVLLDVAATKGK